MRRPLFLALMLLGRRQIEGRKPCTPYEGKGAETKNETARVLLGGLCHERFPHEVVQNLFRLNQLTKKQQAKSKVHYTKNYQETQP